MAIPHAAPGQLIDIASLGGTLDQSVTSTMIKTKRLEVIRLVLPTGKEIPAHKVDGEITVQCLEGLIEFTSPHGTQTMKAGQLLYLNGSESHSLKAIEAASVLVTIQL